MVLPENENMEKGGYGGHASNQPPVVVESPVIYKFSPMTNADRIRSMSDEELANFILHHDVCPGFVTDTFSDVNRKKYGFDGRSERCEWKDECHECWLDWLGEECE